MPILATQVQNTCTQCLRTFLLQNALPIAIARTSRSFSKAPPLRNPQASAAKANHDSAAQTSRNEGGQVNMQDVSASEPESAKGAMYRRLQQAAEDAALEGGRAGRKAIEESGFSGELRDRLLEKVKAAQFQADNASAFAETSLSSSAGRGTRDIATAQAWTGNEDTQDTVLRMLHDAHKPLAPGLRGKPVVPNIVDLRLQPKPKLSKGQRLASAMDRTSVYSISKDSQMTEKEREEMKASLRERFGPAVRTGVMPTTFTGLAALANERIEDAIARGQFKNIPRGQGVERDTRADNPFIDTTEYIMNKMIKRQEIVPPWIEKQQELVKAARNFRARLRQDWKRHAARMISSRGGSLDDKIKLAQLYAKSERAHNPKTRAIEEVSLPTNMTEDPVMMKMLQESQTTEDPDITETVVKASLETKGGEIPVLEKAVSIEDSAATEPPPPIQPLPAPFRDPAWEKNELSYLNLAVTNLNNITRSYNLMAPELAKKPYFNLERELKSCYADAAPEIAEEILARARAPARHETVIGGEKPSGVIGSIVGETAKVYDERKPKYGFKEFWTDLFSKKDGH